MCTRTGAGNELGQARAQHPQAQVKTKAGGGPGRGSLASLRLSWGICRFTRESGLGGEG